MSDRRLKKSKKVEDVSTIEESSPEVLKTTPEVTELDINKIVGYINQSELLRDDNIWNYTQDIYYKVTGYKLERQQCFSCKKTTIMNRLRHHSLVNYNVKIQ